MSWVLVDFLCFFFFSHRCVHMQLNLVLPEHFSMTMKASVCLKALLTL